MTQYTIDLARYRNPDEAGRILAAFIAGQIPVIAEIEPQPDPVLGHTFQWPAQEVAQLDEERRHITELESGQSDK